MSHAVQTRLPREIRALSYSLPTVAALLDHAPGVTTGVVSGVGLEEAAEFVAANLAAITASWTGTTHELAYLRAFAADFTQPAPEPPLSALSGPVATETTETVIEYLAPGCEALYFDEAHWFDVEVPRLQALAGSLLFDPLRPVLVHGDRANGGFTVSDGADSTSYRWRTLTLPAHELDDTEVHGR